MKIKFFLLAVILTATFGINLYAGAGCASCEHDHGTEVKAATEVKTEVKADDSCPDGVCASDKHEHKSTEAAAKEPVKESGDAPATVNTLGLKTLISSGVPLTILDARSGKYDDGRRIPGAQSLNAESKAEEIAKVLPNKESLVITYCANLKCPASHKLYTHLKSLGYTNLIEYPEGIDGWVAAGNPVNAPK